MAHFAELDNDDKVLRVVVISNDDCKSQDGTENESVGIAFCQNLLGEDTRWLQTSYNANDGRGKRGNYAGPEMVYMEGVRTLGVASTDIFIEDPKNIHPSWQIGIQTALFLPPGPPGWPPEGLEKGNLSWYWSEENYNKDPLTAWVLKDHNKEPGFDPDNPPEDCGDCNDTSMVW